jgi:hypothetical protein
MRIAWLFTLIIFFPVPAQACITPFLLPPQDIKDLLNTDAEKFSAIETERLSKFQRDLTYYNTLAITCMGRDRERDEIHREIQRLLKEKWTK